MLGKVLVRLLKGIGAQPQLYLISEEGTIQFYSDEHNGWLASGMTEKEIKKKVKSGEFKEVKF